MDRTFTVGAFAIATLFVLSALSGIAYEGDTLLMSATLKAGKDTDVGMVYVSEDTDNIYVEFVITADGWYLTETHADIQLSAASFPTTKTGNPKVGQFAYSGEHDYVDEVSYTIPKSSIPGWSNGFVVAAHAVVAHMSDETIDFEEYEEHDFVETIETDCGDVDFYMTSSNPLVGLDVGDYVALTPTEGLYPEIAEPDTSSGSGDYEDIVAFTVGSSLRDDWVKDDGGTGAGGMVLTDPQDESQIPLLWHAYSQFQAIVIDLSSVGNLQGMSLAAIDLDHNEVWRFLYFDEDNYLIKEIVKGPMSGNAGDGVAYPIEYDDADIAKVAIFGAMNLNERERVGYALDNIVLTCVDDMETAWGYGTGFEGSSWATYLEWAP